MKERFVTFLDRPITWRTVFKWTGIGILISVILSIIGWVSSLDLKQKHLERKYAQMTIEPRKEDAA